MTYEGLECCPYCRELASHAAPDGVSYCEDCGIVEGETIILTQEEYENA